MKSLSYRAFSLSEVLIALGVLSVGILGVCSVLYYGTRANRTSERHTQAVFWCRELVDTIRTRNLPFTQSTIPPTVVAPPTMNANSGLNDGDIDNDADDSQALKDRRSYNEAPFGDMSGTTNFKRRIEMKLLDPVGTTYKAKIMRIKVSLFWQEGARQRSVTMFAFHRQP